MTVRPMRTNDLPLYGELCRYCFTGVMKAGPHRYMAWVGKHIAHTWGVFDGRTMQAGMWYHPFEMRVGDRYIPMGGVAAVATAPEVRNRGYVRTLMTKAHAQMRDEGRPLAVLMPFKASFYARMGYADTFFQYVCEFNAGQLAGGLRAKAALREVNGGKHWRALEDVYQRSCAHYCGTVLRDGTYWKERWLRASQGLRKTYLVERQGQLVGFVIATLQLTNQTQTPDLNINQAVWADADVFRAILSFIRSHRDQVRKVIWMLPVDVDLYPYFENPNFQMLYEPKMMLKLVDLKGAIESRSYPPDLTAELLLEVTTDGTSPWNVGRWRVTWEDGQASVRKWLRPVRGLPKVKCNIQSLAVMYAGHRSATVLQNQGLIKVPASALVILDSAFPVCTPFVQEWF